MSDIEKRVEEATANGTFNIIDAIRGRSYPKDEIAIYLDEQDAYLAAKITEELKGTEPLSKEYSTLLEKKDAILKRMDENKYLFVISGISEGEREKLQTKAAESFPMEYSETKNAITGEINRTEIQDPERDRYFTNLLWLASIKKITAPDGAIQDSLTLEQVLEMRDSLPLAGIGAITESIEKLRVSTALFMLKVNEDFLAKS